MLSVTGTVLNKAEEKWNEIDVEEDKHPWLKSMAIGMLYGAVDAAVLMYLPLTIGCYYWRKKATKNC